jgi:glycerol-1-phosphate dehydrogenase [NAD(P)+]
MIGKITSLADWRLGSLVWDEPIDDAIFARSQAAIKVCLDNADAIGGRSEEGISELMSALVESGLCMLDFGDSRPASGAEHHASHYWEMMLLQQGRPAVLHGAKVGLALTHVADQYSKIRAISRAELMDRLEAAAPPDRDAQIAHMREGYGELADDLVKGHGPFLDITPAEFDALKQRIVDQWDAIQALAADVPSKDAIVGYLKKVEGVTDGSALGLTEDEVKLGHEYGHYLRNRFTVMKLSRVLGLPLS